MESWNGLGCQGLLEDTSSNPLQRLGHLPLDQVGQSPIQPGLGCFQGWGVRGAPNAWYKAVAHCAV